MAKPINITITGEFPNEGQQTAEISCDDALVIFSNVNGAVMGKAQDGGPAMTRDITAWCGGFKHTTDMYDRLTAAALNLFGTASTKEIAEYNLLNYLMALINNSTLRGRVEVRVSDPALTEPPKHAVPVPPLDGGKDNEKKN